MRGEDGVEAHVGRIWVALLFIALTIVVVTQVNALAPIEVGEGEAPFRTALSQLGILYIVALFVERSLEVLIKAWRQSGKSGLEEEVRTAEDSGKADAEKELQAYRAGTQRRALLIGLTMGVMVSLSGVRLLGPIFEIGEAWAPFQRAMFHFTDVTLTAGLIAGGSATIHELMALIDTFLRESRRQAKERAAGVATAPGSSTDR